MTAFLDTLQDSITTSLSAHTATSGETWAQHPTQTGFISFNLTDRVSPQGATLALYVSTWVPASPDYFVIGDFIKRGAIEGWTYAVGRQDAAALTHYGFGYNISAGQWQLIKRVAGAYTTMAFFNATVADGTGGQGKLEMIGTAIKGYVDGTLRCSVTDSAITATGKMGLLGYSGGSFMDTLQMSADDVSGPAAISGDATLGNWTVSGEASSFPSGISGNATLANWTVSGDVSITGASGVFTSDVLKDNMGVVRASKALTYVRLYDPNTGNLVLSQTGISTNGSGIFTLSSPSIATGTAYTVDWLETVAGNRRMPLKVAT